MGLANGQPSPYDGEYIVAFNVDAHDGRGELFTTADPEQALNFHDLSLAIAYWKRQSTVKPLRADGKPNCPLTAYNIHIR